jgi:HK97 family phage prohead protease
MKILRPSDVNARLAAGETPESIFFDGAGGAVAKLLGPEGAISSISGQKRSFNITISTAFRDRMQDSVSLNWQLKNYWRNSPVLWCHDSSIPAVARGENTRVEGNALRSTAVFPERGVYPFADLICDLIDKKFLNASSVGFIPLKMVPSKDKNRPGGYDILEQELLEYSIVNIPANPECLIQARSAGIDTHLMVGWAERILDTGGLEIIPREELQALRRAAGAPATSASSAAAIAHRRREARELTARARSIIASIPDPVPTTRAQRLAEAQALRRMVMAGEK